MKFYCCIEIPGQNVDINTQEGQTCPAVKAQYIIIIQLPGGRFSLLIFIDFGVCYCFYLKTKKLKHFLYVIKRNNFNPIDTLRCDVSKRPIWRR